MSTFQKTVFMVLLAATLIAIPVISHALSKKQLCTRSGGTWAGIDGSNEKGACIYTIMGKGTGSGLTGRIKVENDCTVAGGTVRMRGSTKECMLSGPALEKWVEKENISIPKRKEGK